MARSAPDTKPLLSPAGGENFTIRGLGGQKKLFEKWVFSGSGSRPPRVPVVGGSRPRGVPVVLVENCFTSAASRLFLVRRGLTLGGGAFILVRSARTAVRSGLILVGISPGARHKFQSGTRGWVVVFRPKFRTVEVRYADRPAALPAAIPGATSGAKSRVGLVPAGRCAYRLWRHACGAASHQAQHPSCRRAASPQGPSCFS